MSRLGSALLLAGLPVVLGLLGTVLVSLGRHRIVPLAACCTGLGLFFATLSWTTVLANVHAPRWQEAAHLGLATTLGISALGLVLAGGAAAATWRLVATPAGTARPLGPAPSTLGLAPGEQAVWIGQAGGSWGWIPPVGGALLGAALIVSTGSPLAAMGPIVVGILLSAMALVQVVVDGSGIRIRFGWLPWPVIRVRLDEVASAEAIEIRPAEWGGWGYRGSRRALGRAAVVVRAGPGIRLELTDGSTMAVTVDDAERAAALLNDLLARAR
jgi:hypothetical protein